MIRHISLDLECLGSKRPTSLIVQIGAVGFDGDDLELGGYAEKDRFMVRIGIDDSLDHGLTVDEGAILFWMDQPDEARRSVFKGKKEKLLPALNRFSAWVREQADGYDGYRIWSHESYDAPILINAYAAAGIKMPRKNWLRDLRTRFEDAYGDYENFPKLERSGTHHDAVDDAAFQADLLKLSLRSAPIPWSATSPRP